MATVYMHQVSDFNELCRICGSKTSVLVGLHIFEREGELRQIYKKIKTCLPIQVSSADKLPKMVCEECVYKLDALFEFHERSVKTDFMLSNMLKQLYSPLCSESLDIQVETFCPSTEHEETLEVDQPEVHIDLINSPDNIDEIITGLPLNHPSGIKCEPELLIKHDKLSRIKPSSSESEGDSLGADEVQTEICTVSAEVVETNRQIQEIRTMEDPMDGKEGEVEEARTFIVTTSTEEGHQSQHPWYYCNICGKPFNSSEEFQTHCESHWKKCHECGITCINDETLLTHLKEAHTPAEGDLGKKTSAETGRKGEMKVCTECGKEYRTNYKLAEHMRKHTGEKPFKCSMCEKAFRSKIGLAQHEAKHTGHFDYNCSTCGKGFQCKSYLIVHQRVHSDLKPYPCETCGRNFKTKQSLLDHQNRHLGVKPYSCETCGRGFITKGLCKSHQKVHSGLDNRQYPCSVCNKLFVSKSYLATHLRIHTGEKPFMCEVCGKGFLTRVDLRIHSTMHTGEKSFVCEMCGKAFARRDALRCHKRSHTGERPYKCDICGQGFTQFSPMAIHKRLHTGERPYACDICMKSFVSRSTMMSHRKKHTV